MTFTISGFGREQTGKRESIPMNETNQRTVAPRKSVVQVSFPDRGGALAYYNDQFDLKIGYMWRASWKVSWGMWSR